MIAVRWRRWICGGGDSHGTLAYPFILPCAAAEYETGEVGGLEVETGINHCTLDRFGDGRHVENPLFEMITGVSENGGSPRRKLDGFQ